MTSDIPAETGSAITSFISQVKNQTALGLGSDWELKAPLELELSTITKGDTGGGIDIRVISFGAKVQAEEVQKMKLVIGPKSEVEEENKKAQIAKAQAEQKYAARIALKGT